MTKLKIVLAALFMVATPLTSTAVSGSDPRPCPEKTSFKLCIGPQGCIQNCFRVRIDVSYILKGNK